MHELADDLADIASPDHPVTVVYACGSGGTGAGLILGAKLLGLAARGIRVAGVNVCDDRAYFVDAIGRICADAEARWQLGANVTAADIDIVDGHVGLGYAKSRPEELATIRDVCRSDGIVLDPVYTGKAFHGVVTELAADRTRFGARVAFIHTGGMFGLFAPSEIARCCEPVRQPRLRFVARPAGSSSESSSSSLQRRRRACDTCLPPRSKTNVVGSAFGIVERHHDVRVRAHDRVRHLVVGLEVEQRLAVGVVGHHAEEHDALALVLVVRLATRSRDLLLARVAPGRPEVHDDDLAGERRRACTRRRAVST